MKLYQTLKNFLEKNWQLIMILILGSAVRILAVKNYGSFWDDEMFSVFYSQQTWADSLNFWLLETNPPLHLLLLKIWFYLLPLNELSARLPSLLFGIGAIITTYYLAKKLFDKNTALLSALILSLESLHIFYSATARVYSLLCFLSTLSFILFYKIFFENKKNKTTIFIFALTQTALLFSHLTAWIFILSEFIILIALKKEDLKKIAKINLVPLVLSSFWTFTSLLNKTNLNKAWFLNIKLTAYGFIAPITSLIFGPSFKIWTLTTLLLYILATILFFYKKLYNKNTYIILTPIILTLSVAACLGVWDNKFIFIITPLVAIFSAIILEKLKIKFLVFIIGIIFIPGIIFLFQNLPISDWQNTKNIINQEKISGQSAIVYSNLFLKLQIDHYLSDFPLEKIPLILNKNDESDIKNTIIKNNYIIESSSDNDLDEWFKAKQLYKYDQIFLLEETKSLKPSLKNTLEHNGFKLKQDLSSPHTIYDHHILNYEKNI